MSSCHTILYYIMGHYLRINSFVKWSLAAPSISSRQSMIVKTTIACLIAAWYTKHIAPCFQYVFIIYFFENTIRMLTKLSYVVVKTNKIVAIDFNISWQWKPQEDLRHFNFICYRRILGHVNLILLIFEYISNFLKYFKPYLLVQWGAPENKQYMSSSKLSQIVAD